MDGRGEESASGRHVSSFSFSFSRELQLRRQYFLSAGYNNLTVANPVEPNPMTYPIPWAPLPIFFITQGCLFPRRCANDGGALVEVGLIPQENPPKKTYRTLTGPQSQRGKKRNRMRSSLTPGIKFRSRCQIQEVNLTSIIPR